MDECAQEGELQVLCQQPLMSTAPELRQCAECRAAVIAAHTRCTGVIDANVAWPAIGFLLSQSFAHCPLCVWIASSSARL
jgi:hypothetical protein